MSLVLQLQEYALNPGADLCNLLHKALVVASKLKVEKLERWVRCELDGYPTEDVPSYRILRGQLRARMPHFDRPVSMPTRDLMDKIATYQAQESIAAIGEFLTRANGSIEVCWDDQSTLRKLFEVRAEFYLSIPSPQFRGILNAVKTQVLDWSLNLERDGITGTGLQFSETEKMKAANDADKLIPVVVKNYIRLTGILNQTNNNDGGVNNEF